MSQRKTYSAVKIFIALITSYVAVNTVAASVLLFGSGFEHRRIQKLLDDQVSVTHVIEGAANWVFIGAAEAAIFSFVPSAVITIYAMITNPVRLTTLVIIGMLVTTTQIIALYVAARVWAGTRYGDSDMILVISGAFLLCTSCIANLLAWRFLRHSAVTSTP